MSYESVETRVDRLEAVLGQFLTQLALSEKRAEERNRLAEERNRLAEERNRAAEERSRLAEERMARFEREMREFKDEMREFKEQMVKDRKELNKKWGELANKMGTIVEDILAPNLRRLAVEHFGFPVVEHFMIRCQRRRPGDLSVEKEFDTIVAGPGAVILGEAKSSPTLEHAIEFAGKGGEFFDYFPEYKGRRLILVFGSWAIPEAVVRQLTGLGIYAMQMGDETMELVNAAELEGRG